MINLECQRLCKILIIHESSRTPSPSMWRYYEVKFESHLILSQSRQESARSVELHYRVSWVRHKSIPSSYTLQLKKTSFFWVAWQRLDSSKEKTVIDDTFVESFNPAMCNLRAFNSNSGSTQRANFIFDTDVTGCYWYPSHTLENNKCWHMSVVLVLTERREDDNALSKIKIIIFVK